jgi:hypothetical protein
LLFPNSFCDKKSSFGSDELEFSNNQKKTRGILENFCPKMMKNLLSTLRLSILFYCTIIQYMHMKKKWWVIIIVTVLLLALALVLGNFFGVPSKFFRAAVDVGPIQGIHIPIFGDLFRNPSGACCVNGVSCSTEKQFTCLYLGGTFHKGKQCNEVACGQGACCLPGPENVCIENSTFEVCESTGGTHNPGASCDEASCEIVPVLSGACCYGGGCTETFNLSCEASVEDGGYGGTFHADASCNTIGIQCLPDNEIRCGCDYNDDPLNSGGYNQGTCSSLPTGAGCFARITSGGVLTDIGTCQVVGQCGNQSDPNLRDFSDNNVRCNCIPNQNQPAEPEP